MNNGVFMRNRQSCRLLWSQLRFIMIFTFAIMGFPQSAEATDFVVDGVYYNIIDFQDLTCSVYGAQNMTDIVIPTKVSYNGKELTVVRIEDMAFWTTNGNMRTISIGGEVTYIGENAFKGCTKLWKVRLEDGTSSVYFKNQNDGTPSYGDNLFVDCPLTELYIGRNLSYFIGTFAYEPIYFPPFNGKSYSKVTIGNTVTEIAASMFNNSSIDTLVIGTNVKKIGRSCFYGKYGGGTTCKVIYCYASTPPVFEYEGYFINSVYLDTPLYVVEGCKSLYESAEYWGNFWNIIEIPKEQKAESIRIEVAKVEIGGFVTLRAIVLPDDVVNKEVDWSSSDEDVARVHNGIVAGVSVGNATITATTTDGTNLSAQYTITVARPITNSNTKRGDINSDDKVDIADVVSILNIMAEE